MAILSVDPQPCASCSGQTEKRARPADARPRVAGTVHLLIGSAAERRRMANCIACTGYRVQTWDGGRAFLRAAGSVAPGCIFADLELHDMDGLDLQRTLRNRGIAWPIVFFAEATEVRSAVLAMRAGAFDFLQKPIDPSELRVTLKQAFVRVAACHEDTAALARTRIASLTAREREVFLGLIAGLPNKTIAYDLGISTRTIEVHRANIMRKLDAPSLAHALRVAFEGGL